MKLKTLVAAAALAAAGMVAFAQSAECARLLAEAKDCAVRQKWVDTLGADWDSMEAEPTEKAVEVLNAYNALGHHRKREPRLRGVRCVRPVRCMGGALHGL